MITARGGERWEGDRPEKKSERDTPKGLEMGPVLRRTFTLNPCGLTAAERADGRCTKPHNSKCRPAGRPAYTARSPASHPHLLHY